MFFLDAQIIAVNDNVQERHITFGVSQQPVVLFACVGSKKKTRGYHVVHMGQTPWWQAPRNYITFFIAVRRLLWGRICRPVVGHGSTAAFPADLRNVYKRRQDHEVRCGRRRRRRPRKAANASLADEQGRPSEAKWTRLGIVRNTMAVANAESWLSVRQATVGETRLRIARRSEVWPPTAEATTVRALEPKKQWNAATMQLTKSTTIRCHLRRRDDGTTAGINVEAAAHRLSSAGRWRADQGRSTVSTSVVKYVVVVVCRWAGCATIVNVN